jgi:lipopolysaccharide export LptBFGC system permease protein LptF
VHSPAVGVDGPGDDGAIREGGLSLMLLIQRYITRELLKTFFLTALGLTLVFSLGGGVFNMIRVEVLTAVQLWSILVRIVPVATTLTLPVAALFSTAMVYGRLSLDNEFNACRASGINVHRLVAPAFAVGLFVAAFTFYFSNYVIPRFVEGLEQIVRNDPQKAVAQMLYTRGYLEVQGKYVIHADAFNEYSLPATPQHPDAERDRFVELRGASFVELENGELIRYGTTPKVTIEFTAGTVQRDPTVMARMEDVRLFDQQRRQFYSLGEQRLGPVPIPWKFRRKNKFMNLPELLYYREHSWELPEVEEALPKIRGLMHEFLFYQALTAGMTGPQKKYRFGTPQEGYEITAAAVPVDPDSGHPRLDQPLVRQWWDGVKRTFRAGSGEIVVERGFGGDVPSAYIKLGNDVSFTDDVDPTKVIRRTRVELEPVSMPPDVVGRAAAISDADLLDYRKPLGLSPRIDEARRSLYKGQQALVRRLTCEIHSRCAFSASVLVLVVLGAALGIIFRGGQMLTAFVISFLPGLFTTVMNIMGRQLSEKDNTALLGLGVMWGGIAIVTLVDAVVLTRFLRR